MKVEEDCLGRYQVFNNSESILSIITCETIVPNGQDEKIECYIENI